MPFFTEGEPDPRQQPVPDSNFDSSGAPPPAPSLPQGIVPATPAPATPSPFDTVGAEFRKNNSIVSLLSSVSEQNHIGEYDPNWNPRSIIKGTKYEQRHGDRFLGDINENETRWRMAQIDKEENDDRIRAAGGTLGTVSGLAAGLMDWPTAIPIMGEIGIAGRGAGRAWNAAEHAAGLGLSGAVQSGAQESVLHATQQTRPWSESVGNVASSAILMGILGGAIGTLSKSETKAASDALDATRPHVSVDPQTSEARVEPSPHLDDEPASVNRKTGEFYTRPGTAEPQGSFGQVGDIGTRPYPTAGPALPDRLSATRNVAAEARFGAELKSAGIYSGDISADLTHRAERLMTSDTLDHASVYEDAAISRAIEEDHGLAKEIYGDEVHGGAAHGDGASPVKTGEGGPGEGLHGAGETRGPEGAAVSGTGDTLARSVGAAAADERDLVPIGFGLNKLGIISDKVLNRLSPNLRVFVASQSVQAKRVMADLVETAIRFTQHARGIPTSLRGPVESVIRVEKNQYMAAYHDALQHAWEAHRFEGQANASGRAGAAMSDLTGRTPEGKLSYGKFKENVTDALNNGDVHPIPEVQQAAQEIRSKVLDPIKERAQATRDVNGNPLLNEELETPRGAKSFFPHMWDKEKVRRNYDQLRKRFADWLEGQQAEKAAAKDRLTTLQGKHADLAKQVDKLERRLETLTERQSDTGSRLAERGEEKERAAERTETVAERAEKVQAATDELREYVEAVRNHVKTPDEREAFQRLESQLETLERQGRDLKVRGQEAEIPRTASGSRYDSLRERADRQGIARDLLEAARHNAETERIKIRERMEQEIRDWKGDSTADAVKALKVRDESERIRGLKQQAGIYEGKGERLTSADGPVDRAVKRIIKSDRDLDRGELEARASEWIDRIISSPDGRIPYDIHTDNPAGGYHGTPDMRGSLNARETAIPYDQIKDFLHRDTEMVLGAHLRTILPDMHLVDRFGDVNLTEAMRRIQEEYAAKITDKTSEAKSAKLIAQRDSDIKDIAAMRDRLRGVFGWTPGNALSSLTRNIHNWTTIQSLGTSVINRFNDAGAQAVFRYGFMHTFSDLWAPLFKAMAFNPEVMKIGKAEAREMGIGIDGMLGHMRHNLTDVSEMHTPGDKFSKGLAWAADRSMIVNMHGPWTDWIKAANWIAAQSHFAAVAKRITETGGTERDLAAMADANLDRATMARISAMYEKHASDVGGVRMAHAGQWEDQVARDAFARALTREVNINVITAGHGDRPLIMSKPMGALIGQFKGFTAGTHEKILISNLQQRDGRTLQGLLTSVAMGMLSYRLYTLASGQQASPRPQDWIKEGIHRSAITGWFSEANNTMARFTSGKIDYNRLYGADRPLSRRAEESALSDLLGPAYSQAEGVTGVLGHVFGGHTSAQDIHNLRKMFVPMQNLMGFRALLDNVEDGVARSMGMKPREHTPSQTWNQAPPQ